MDIREIVNAIIAGDLIAARQWVSDAKRKQLKWANVPRPTDIAGSEMAIAAGIVELLAGRAGEMAPSWTIAVGAAREPVVLDPGLEEMPRSFARAKTVGPEPLRKRNLLALPDFLDVV